MYTIYASVQDLIDRIMWMLSPGPTMIQLRWGASWLLGISAALVSIPSMRNRPGTGDFATLVATAGDFRGGDGNALLRFVMIGFVRGRWRGGYCSRHLRMSNELV
jgi:hypothetical protein